MPCTRELAANVPMYISSQNTQFMCVFSDGMVLTSFINALLNTYICHPAYLGECTRLKKRCRVKSINYGQCDTMELWEDGRGWVLFLDIQNIFFSR